MGKGLQIVFLTALFVICGVGGFFLGEFILPDVSEEVAEAAPVVQTPVVEVETVPTVPAVPQLDNVSTPEYGTDRKYSFTAKAQVSTGDALDYVLYSDETCQKEVARNRDGVFAGLVSNSAGTYYLRVVNTVTDESTAAVPVKGFVFKYDKISKTELEKICNSGDFTSAPPKFNHRVSSKLVITTKGMKEDERGVASIADICHKVEMNKWQSIAVEHIGYDSQYRMNKLVINVNYPL